MDVRYCQQRTAHIVVVSNCFKPSGFHRETAHGMHESDTLPDGGEFIDVVGHCDRAVGQEGIYGCLLGIWQEGHDRLAPPFITGRLERPMPQFVTSVSPPCPYRGARPIDDDVVLVVDRDPFVMWVVHNDESGVGVFTNALE